MNIAEHLKVKGLVRLTFRDVETGEVRVRESHNLVVNVGLAHIWRMLFGVTGYTKMCYLAVGSGITTPTASDTTLTTETASSRNEITSGGIAITNGQCTISVFFTTAQANGVVAEVGILSASSGGNLLNHALFDPAETKTATQTMTVDLILTAEGV